MWELVLQQPWEEGSQGTGRLLREGRTLSQPENPHNMFVCFHHHLPNNDISLMFGGKILSRVNSFLSGSLIF